MEAIFTVNAPAITSFLLTLIRVSLLVFLLPFYGGQNFPNTAKAATCIIISLAIWPHMSFSGSYLPAHPLAIAVMVLGEMLIGLMLSLYVHFIFAGVQTAGQLMGFQMGFTMMQIADPMSGSQIPGLSHLLYMVALVVFLTLNGHLYLLQSLTSSFAIVPPGGFFARPVLLIEIIRLSSLMFILAAKIAGPILAALFLIELALALMARVAPQMNLLIIGMPVKIAVGFFFMFIVFSLLARTIEESIYDLRPLSSNLLQMSAPE